MPSRLAWSVAALLAVGGTAASAGPPYETDDPAPTELHHWEIYTFAEASGTGYTFDGSTGLDLNYGAMPGVQLTATLPIGFARENGRWREGAGDIELGVKYRFLGNEKSSVSLAIFPRVILPTGKNAFGSPRTRLLLPVWSEKDWGDWSLFGGGGYEINPGRGNRNFWVQGIALTRSITEDFSLGVEATHKGRDSREGLGAVSFGVGGIHHLVGPLSLLASFGPTFVHRDGTQFHLYVALGLNF